MSDTTYSPKTYRKDGGDTQVVASGGNITVESGGTVTVASGAVVTIAAVGGLKIGTDNVGVATIADVTATAAEINKTDGIEATGYLVIQASALFTQTSGNGAYTATIPLPAGSNIIDVAVHGLVLWNASTSASLIVGDAADDNGFFVATDLKATDLLAGEVNNIEHPGGKAGAYIVDEQRVLYQAAARNVIGVVTQVGTGTQGRTLLTVTYATPTAAAATKA